MKSIDWVSSWKRIIASIDPKGFGLVSFLMEKRRLTR